MLTKEDIIIMANESGLGGIIRDEEDNGYLVNKHGELITLQFMEFTKKVVDSFIQCVVDVHAFPK